MTKAEMTTKITEEVKGLSSYLVNDDYSNACDDAARETGWAFPITTDFKVYWQKQRAIRHLLFYLVTERSYKFRYKQINLQHRFRNLKDMIMMLDKNFTQAQESSPNEFANVSAYNLFGTKIDSGFAYEPQTGRDITYDEDQDIIFAPDENT